MPARPGPPRQAGKPPRRASGSWLGRTRGHGHWDKIPSGGGISNNTRLNTLERENLKKNDSCQSDKLDLDPIVPPTAAWPPGRPHAAGVGHDRHRLHRRLLVSVLSLARSLVPDVTSHSVTVTVRLRVGRRWPRGRWPGDPGRGPGRRPVGGGRRTPSRGPWETPRQQLFD